MPTGSPLMRGHARARPRRYSGGFALLEALVALVIVAGVGTALFALVNTGLQNLRKAEAHIASTTLQPHILAWVRTLDLSELPAAREATLTLQTERGAYRAEALAQRFHGPLYATAVSGSPGIHQIALYNVTVNLFQGERQLETLHTRMTASRQVADAPSL